MYGKLFDSTFTGSMVGAGSDVFAVWAYVIANTHHGRVELNPKLLAMIIGTDAANVEAAIEYLTAPDPASRSEDYDGRRMIQEGQYQYLVVNHERYRKILNAEERREYNRLKKAESRARSKAKAAGGASSGVNPAVNDSQDLSAQPEPDAEPESEPESEPARAVVSARLEQAAFKVYGMACVTLAEWVEAYGEAWTFDAIAETQSAGASKPNYTRAILQRWKRDGRAKQTSAPPARNGTAMDEIVANAVRETAERQAEAEARDARWAAENPEKAAALAAELAAKR